MPNLNGIVSAPLAALTCALALVACGGDDGGSDAGTGGPDASTSPDTGSGPADTGMTTPTDSGVPAACNPVDGSGCGSADRFCVLDLAQDRGVCRSLPAMNAFGASCDLALQDCAPGLLCAAFTGDMGPTCHQACRAGMSDCASVPDTSSVYACAVTGDGNDFGACRSAGGPSCNPLDMIPCPSGQVCSVVAAFETACQAAGTTQLGGSCMASNCAVGQGICFNLTDIGQNCFEPCNLAQPACSQAGYRCAEIGNGMMSYPFGLCLPPAMGECNPLTNPCPGGQVCALNQTNNGVECVPEGTAPIGSDCSTVNCARGGFCVAVQGGGRICAAPCDLAAPMCPGGGACQNIGLDFGLCGG